MVVTPPSDGRYAKEFLAGWATMDINGHMANTSYLDLAADVRMAFFAEHGFPPAEFRKLLAAFAKAPRAQSFVELPPLANREV